MLKHAGYSDVIMMEVCTETYWLIQVSAISILPFQNNYVSNVKGDVDMQRKDFSHQK